MRQTSRAVHASRVDRRNDDAHLLASLHRASSYPLLRNCYRGLSYGCFKADMHEQNAKHWGGALVAVGEELRLDDKRLEG